MLPYEQHTSSSFAICCSRRPMPSLLFFIVYVVGNKNVFRAKLAKKILMAKAVDEKKGMCSKNEHILFAIITLMVVLGFLMLVSDYRFVMIG